MNQEPVFNNDTVEYRKSYSFKLLMFASKVKFTGGKIFQFLLKKDKKNVQQFLRKLQKNLFIGLEVLRRKIFAQESANLLLRSVLT